MIGRDKIVRAVETCFDSWIDKHQDMGLDLHKVEQLKRDALELLKEQEPVKPMPTAVENESVKPIDNGDDTYACDKCGETVGLGGLDAYGIDPVKYKYCPGCGREVKWDE